jgi:hypothetical protein
MPTPKLQPVPLSALPPPKRTKRGGARNKAQQLQEQLGVEADEGMQCIFSVLACASLEDFGGGAQRVLINRALT